MHLDNISLTEFWKSHIFLQILQLPSTLCEAVKLKSSSATLLTQLTLHLFLDAVATTIFTSVSTKFSTFIDKNLETEHG